MGKVIVGVGLAGWASIVALAWAQANARITALCGPQPWASHECVAKMEAKRDAILLGGLTVALAYILICLCVFAVVKARQPKGAAEPRSSWRPTSRERQAQPSLGVERR